ncbi:MAG: PadR family transcriptional regulator [Candidatus Hodarchaeota archaeon]
MFGKNLDVTPTEALFLLVLYNHKNVSGTEIVNQVKEDLGEDWSPTPGATYKVLQKLLTKGFILETTNTEEEDRDQRIRTYSLTSEGNSMVIKVIARMQKVIGFVDSCCPGETDRVIIIKKQESNESN